MNFGESLKQIRKVRGLKAYEFADLIGLSPGYYSGIEKGDKRPTFKVLEKCSKGTGIPVQIIFWFSLEREDIKEEHRLHYDRLKPLIDKLINELI